MGVDHTAQLANHSTTLHFVYEIYNKKIFETFDDAAWGMLEVKVDEVVHQWKVLSGLILEQLYQTACKLLHSGVPSAAAELIGQHLEQNYQNIFAAHLLMEVEDAVLFEYLGFDWLMCLFLNIRQLIIIIFC